MYRFWILLALLLVIGACGDDNTTDLVPPTLETPGDSTAQSGGNTTVPTSPTTSSTVPATSAAGPTDCLEIWPEAAVQAIAGNAYTFLAANNDRSACTYFGTTNGIALAWRTGDRTGFEASMSGAGVVSGSTDIALCDAGFYTEIQDAVLIMEAHSDAQGRTYTATMSGLDSDDAREWAAALLSGVC